MTLVSTATEIPSVVKFESKSYSFSAGQQDFLLTLADKMKTDASLAVQLEQGIVGVKPASLIYIIERNRSLRVFQELVRLGVDPWRIEYASVLPRKAAENEMSFIIRKSDQTSIATKIIPTAQESAAQPDDFTINFPSGSATPLNLSEESFLTFLKSVGQVGRDAIVIEGFTDTVGNPAYNKALGEFRALTVYEKLIRSGLPPYRVDTQSHGMEHAQSKGESAADRKVIARWTRNISIAEKAKTEEAVLPQESVPQETPQVAAQELPQQVEPVKEPPAAESQAKDDRFEFDLVPFVGFLVPGRELNKNAKSNSVFGLGVGKAFIKTADSEVRATLFASSKSELKAKQEDRSGPLQIQFMSLRTDYAFDAEGNNRPFVGLGVGTYLWNGEIVQPSSSRVNTGKHSDLGASVTIGYDFFLRSNLMLAPDLSVHKVGGNFAEFIGTLALNLRWRI